MDQHFIKVITEATQAERIERIELIQNLWSGYGEIVRYKVVNSQMAHLNSIIVKHVRLPQETKHPRGWNTDLSHERKVRSYEIETQWYKDYNALCNDDCRTPHCLALEHKNDEVLMVLEDLDDSDFPERRSAVSREDIHVCLRWLANFHATFMLHTPDGLWESGTYWHLQTRPEELDALQDVPLKNAAERIDQRLRQAKYQSFVHGDAKLANFCFGKDIRGNVQVAALDFQYVGGGCGMKDVAYFIGSCLYEEDCESYEQVLLDDYCSELNDALLRLQPTIDAQDVVQEWRNLYPMAWADFHRFLKGWSPGHWKINSYSERVCREVIEILG